MKMNYDSLRGQCVLLLLAALAELGRKGTKREVLEHIARRRYFEVGAEDRLPFPTALQPEPRWELLMGLAWTTCLDGGCIVESEGDLWQLTDEGTEFYRQSASQFQDGTFDAHRCFLWTARFKKRVVPGYSRRPDERPRPLGLYHDLQRHLTSFGMVHG
jgi:hypothetical protein